MKKSILIGAGVFLIICISFIIYSQTKVIGSVRGAEMEIIEIDGVRYEQDNTSGFTSIDRDKFLGIVTNDNVKFRVYTVKGDEDHEYLFRLWEWEGAFYKREEAE